jgi:NADPH:quinone reductase-like Zn-dependent oxidoreductase
MKEIVCTRSGRPEVLQLQDVVKPIPKENEVLIRVHAATVTVGTVMFRKLHPLLFSPYGFLV